MDIPDGSNPDAEFEKLLASQATDPDIRTFEIEEAMRRFLESRGVDVFYDPNVQADREERVEQLKHSKWIELFALSLAKDETMSLAGIKYDDEFDAGYLDIRSVSSVNKQLRQTQLLAEGYGQDWIDMIGHFFPGDGIETMTAIDIERAVEAHKRRKDFIVETSDEIGKRLVRAAEETLDKLEEDEVPMSCSIDDVIKFRSIVSEITAELMQLAVQESVARSTDAYARQLIREPDYERSKSRIEGHVREALAGTTLQPCSDIVLDIAYDLIEQNPYR
jgi:hypothetical protein